MRLESEPTYRPIIFFYHFLKALFDKIESAHFFIKIILQMKALESFLIFCDTFYFKILEKNPAVVA